MIPSTTFEADLTEYFRGDTNARVTWRPVAKNPPKAYVPPPWYTELTVFHPNKHLSKEETTVLLKKIQEMWMSGLDPKTRSQFKAWKTIKQRYAKRYAVRVTIHSLYFS